MTQGSGEYRRMLLEQRGQSTNRSMRGTYREEDLPFPWYRIRFYICLVLFLCYVFLDYTGTSIQNIGSKQILEEIQKDMTEDLPVDMDATLAWVMDQITITEEGELP